MEERLTDYLLSFTALTTLVGTRITWLRRPQGSDLPAVVLHRIDGLPDYTMDGASGIVSSRIQIDAWGATFASAKGVARQVIARLSGARVSISNGDSPPTFVVMHGSFVEGERDDYETAAGGTNIFYRCSVDFIIWSTPG